MFLKLKPSQVFGKNGLAASALPGYEYRAEQERMMAAVQKAIMTDDVIIVEAGTGVGKTLAYLVPAVASGRQTVVATGTRTLMEQLVNKDLAILSGILGEPVDAAVLKGRSNYLCLARLDMAMDSPDLFQPDDRRLLGIIRRWCDETKTGDVGQLSGVAEDDAILRSVVCQADTCTGRVCPFYSRCFLFRARARALEAELVITNHHLLMADLAMSDGSEDDSGAGPLLPSDANLIIDEAHGLEDVATVAFGLVATRAGVAEISRDTLALANHADPRTARVVVNVARRLDDGFVKLLNLVAGRRERCRLADGPDDVQLSKQAVAAWHGLDQDLEAVGIETTSIAREMERTSEIPGRVAQVRATLCQVLDRDDGSMVRIVERKGHGGSFAAYPVDVSTILRQKMFQKGRPIVLTSATMSVAGQTAFFRSRLGIPEGAPECVLQSPYDYASNVVLYIPSGMPVPTDDNWPGQVIDETVRLVELVGGRTLVLFTSRAALNRAAVELPERVGYPILVQGTMQRGELVERFRSAGNAVLLATAAFREGLDIAGGALSCVIMDRLPFEPPDEPLLVARSDRMRLSGQEPFFHYQVPLAAIRLRQGFGRLVRRRTDRGVVAILDPRIANRNYGKIFLDSLPPAFRATEFEAVRSWCLRNLLPEN